MGVWEHLGHNLYMCTQNVGPLSHTKKNIYVQSCENQTSAGAVLKLLLTLHEDVKLLHKTCP